MHYCHGSVMAARFFVDASAIDGSKVRVSGDDAHHLAAPLRMHRGDLIVVVEDGRVEHGVLLHDVHRDMVRGDIVWTRAATGEPSLQVHVLQAIPQRGMDEAVEALAELGATSIRPLVTNRTIVRGSAAAMQHRLQRWRTIAREAAQLAGRARAPVIHAPASVAGACDALPEHAQLLATTPQAADPLGGEAFSAERPLVLAIGPEGGFDEIERRTLRESGAREVHLGPRVLPARLAGVATLAIVLAAAGELDAAAPPPPKI